MDILVECGNLGVVPELGLEGAETLEGGPAVPLAAELTGLFLQEEGVVHLGSRDVHAAVVLDVRPVADNIDAGCRIGVVAQLVLDLCGEQIGLGQTVNDAVGPGEGLAGIRTAIHVDVVSLLKTGGTGSDGSTGGVVVVFDIVNRITYGFLLGLGPRLHGDEDAGVASRNLIGGVAYAGTAESMALDIRLAPKIIPGIVGEMIAEESLVTSVVLAVKLEQVHGGSIVGITLATRLNIYVTDFRSIALLEAIHVETVGAVGIPCAHVFPAAVEIVAARIEGGDGRMGNYEYCFLVVFVVWTVLVKVIDVQYVGAAGFLGFYSLNTQINDFVQSQNTELFNKLTDVLMYIAISTLVPFAVVGLVQLIKRKDLKKVDSAIYIILAGYVAMVVIYLAFEIVKINY